MDLVKQSFDVFQRFKAIGDIVKNLALPLNPNFLDVGGYPGTLADYLRGIFPGMQILTLDRPICKRDDYISGNANSLPFKDASFDVVISSDMIEHLNPVDRGAAIREMLRVSRSHAIIGAPFKNDCVDFAEEKINALFEKCMKSPHPWLSEHRKHPLPGMNAICGIIEQTGASVQVFPNGSVISWFILEVVGILLDIYPGLFPVKSDLSLHFNRFWAAQDDCEPAYRHFLLVNKKGIPFPDIKIPGTSFPEKEKEVVLPKLEALFKIADEISQKILSLLSNPKENERLLKLEYIQKLEKIISFQEEEQKKMQDQMKNQKKHLEELESKFLYRLLRKFGLV